MKLKEKKTLILGASTNPDRTSYTAIHMLNAAGVPIVAVGLKEAVVDGISIQKGLEGLDVGEFHTVTMYMNAQRQAELEDFILSLKPKRIIFNPGAENAGLAKTAQSQGIESKEACTLVMLSLGQF